MDLTARFAKVASGNIASLDTLIVGRRYFATHAQRQETIRTVHSGDPETRPYRRRQGVPPKRFTNVFLESDIELINTGTRTYHLVSHGRYPNGRAYKLTLED